MTIETTTILTGCVLTGISAMTGIIYQHISNDEKHPHKGDMVFGDVCKEKHKGLDDYIVAKFETVTAKIDDLKEIVERIDSKIK